MSVTICHVSEELKEMLAAFKFSKAKTNQAIIMKIDKKTCTVDVEEKVDNVDIEEMSSELPSHEPRYIALSYVYKHSDGRISYPYLLIFSTPIGCKPEMQMMYAGSLQNLQEVAQVTKTFEVRNPEEITVEWLEEKLKYFR